jgi:hypothetical protein
MIRSQSQSGAESHIPISATGLGFGFGDPILVFWLPLGVITDIVQN